MRANPSGISKDAIKANNMHAILTCIYKNAPISRRDIAKTVHLTSSTITLLVADMLQYGILRECGETTEEARAGRRVVQLDFNPDFGCILGICIEPSGISFALTRFCGRNIEEKYVVDRMTIDNRFSRDELLPELLRLADAFVRKQVSLPGGLRAIGISMTGHVDPVAGISLNSYGVFPPRTQLAAAFERQFGVPTLVDNNVRSLALAEMAAYKADEMISGLFVKQDPGFGCTVLLGGEVYEGSSYSSGEIGHTRVVDNGKPCICGKTGCLSTVVSTEALTDSARAAFSPSTTPALWADCAGDSGRISVPAILRSARAGDVPVARMLDEAARLLEGVLETGLLLMDGDVVIAFGPLFEDEWFIERLRVCLNNSFSSFRKIELVHSRLSDKDRWKGAAAIAMHRCLGPISADICDNNT